MPYKDKNKQHKYQCIYRWKNWGIICEDFDKLYEKYMNINNCELCGIEFNKNIRSQWKNLDHDHKTGLYRHTICHNCNSIYDKQNRKLNHAYLEISKQKIKSNGKLFINFKFQRIINNKLIVKQSTSLIKLIAFSFIQELKNKVNKKKI